MTIRRTKARIAAVGCAAIVLGLAGGSLAVAKSPGPERGTADPPAKSSPPKTRAATARVVQVGSGQCGTETYAVEVDGRRVAVLC
jgi:hypothetical protein